MIFKKFYKRKLKKVLFLVSILYLIYIYFYNNIENEFTKQEIELANLAFNFEHESNVAAVDLKVLVLCRSTKSNDIKNLVGILRSLRFKYKLATVYSLKLNKTIILSDKHKAYFTLIIFESIDVYKSIGFLNRKYLLDYCKNFKIGLLFLLSQCSTFKSVYLIDKIKLETNIIDFKSVNKCRLVRSDNNSDSFFRLTKFTKEHLFLKDNLPGSIIDINKDSNEYEPVLICGSYNLMLKTKDSENLVRQIFIGFNTLNLPILSSLLIDAFSFLSFNRLNITTERYIQIDIDDIFVAAKETRMKSDDVYALIKFQKFINEIYFNQSQTKFKFNLGKKS